MTLCETNLKDGLVLELRAPSCSPPSPDIKLSLYAKRTFYKDILVGTYEIPLEPQQHGMSHMKRYSSG